tara:strand:+ start:113 stop:373 length:261 start_codon:yes stop_codon:yes gene_type:complete
MRYTIKDHNAAVARRWNNPETLTKKPDNWQELKSHELTPIIHELNCWNASQAISDAEHNAHYKSEIAPLVKLKDALNKAWINKTTQ